MQIGPGEQHYTLRDEAPGSEGSGVFVLFTKDGKVVFVGRSLGMRGEIDRLILKDKCVSKLLPATFQYQACTPSTMDELSRHWRKEYKPLCP